MIAYLTGIAVVAFLPTLTSVGWLLLIASVSALHRPWRRTAFLLVLGLLVASAYGHRQLAHRYQLPPRDLVVSAEVVGLPVLRNGYYSLLLQPLDMPPELRHVRRIKASYYGGDQVFAQGDRLQVELRLKSPRGLSNPAAFDLERHYLAQGIDARGYIRQVIEHKSAAFSLQHGRQYLADLLERRFSAVTAVTLRALVLGDRSGLSPEQWDVLRVTGTAHLFVVSGLHVAVIAALGWWGGRLLQLPALWLGRQGSGWRLLPPLAALAVAGCYAWLSGWGIPVQRAWLMLAVFMAGSWWLRPVSGWQRWRLALILILTLQPLSVLETGLWLSFGAVALILWLWQCRPEQADGAGRYLGVGLRVQLGLFVGMLPMMAAGFNQISLLSVPVNLLAIPLLSVLIWLLPALLLASGFSNSLIRFIDMAVELLWQCLSWAAQVPGMYAELASPSVVSLLLSTVAVLLLLLPVAVQFRLLLVPFMLPMLSATHDLPGEGVFHAWVFDVGQGQAVLIETAEGALLYDTGPGYPGGGAAFPFAIKPLLQSQGVRQLGALVISHGDSDHAGGLAMLNEFLDIERVYAGEPEKLPGSSGCPAGRWQSGGVNFQFQQAFSDTEGLSSNNRSCILRIDNGHCSLLLTGDLDTSGEYRMLSAGYRQPVTWLVAGHHGSRDSTSAAILDWLQPHAVLISAGHYNRFGHPHVEVIRRLDERNIPWLKTADSGAIKLVAEREQCSIQRHREQKKRYWTAS